MTQNYIEKEMTIAEIERWLAKLETLSSQGAKVAHVAHLLIEQRERLAKEIAGKLEKEMGGFVRDVTKVGYMPKSEARRRIQEIINELKV